MDIVVSNFLLLDFQPILNVYVLDIERGDLILDMQCRNIKGFLFIRQILLSTIPYYQ